jgi:hypothetical protein
MIPFADNDPRRWLVGCDAGGRGYAEGFCKACWLLGSQGLTSRWIQDPEQFVPHAAFAVTSTGLYLTQAAGISRSLYVTRSLCFMKAALNIISREDTRQMQEDAKYAGMVQARNRIMASIGQELQDVARGDASAD